MDYKQTTHYWGLNREDEFYEKENNLRKPPHKRKRKWPSIEEFWTSMELKPFKLYCNEYADYRKFRRWLRIQVFGAENKAISYEEEARARFIKEFDICMGNYEEAGVVNTEMAVFKWDYTYFMTKDEIKALKEKPEVYKIPKAFDLTKAERVHITKEDIKSMELKE